MTVSVVATTGNYSANFPSWGRCFWQDPNDGAMFLAYTSGNTEVDYIYSTNDGVDWSTPAQLFPIDDFSVDNNYDIHMDARGHIHSTFKWNGSGCYQFTGRVTGAGYSNASGVGPAGFCQATDGASSSKGLHASLFIADGPVHIISESQKKFPLARIACKRADQEVNVWNVKAPHNTYPVLESGFSRVGHQAGPQGGYPILTNIGLFNAIKLVYSASGDYIRAIDSGNANSVQELPITPYANHMDTGNSGLIPFGAQMAWSSGIIANLVPIVVSSPSGFEMWGVIAEQEGGGNTVKRVDSAASLLSFTSTQRRAPNGIPLFASGPSGNVTGVTQNGTLIDMSFGNTKDAFNLYFLGHDAMGVQNVGRILFRVQNQHAAAGSRPAQPFQFDFSSTSHFVSGIRNFAPATQAHVGGNDGLAHWNSFKALKHPSSPGQGVNKKEFVATIGGPAVYPSGFNIVMWNFNDSVAATEEFHHQVYETEYVATSGSSISIIDPIDGLYRTLRVSNASRAFDDSVNNDATFGHGSSMTLKLTRPTLITKLEMITNGVSSSNRFPGAIISGSIDGENWNYIHTMSSGFSSNDITLSSNNPLGSDVDERMNPWVVQYLKFDFIQDQKKVLTHALTEMHLYGPGQTKGVLTIPFNSPLNHVYAIVRPEASRSTQRFNTCTEGTLPGSDWRTLGDFTWGVRSSGSWSRTNNYPHYPYPQNGLVGSGLWAGVSNGNGDGFSLKPNDDVPPLTSGVVDVNIHVYTGEISRVSGIADTRTISFDYRTDFVDSEDRLDVYVGAFGSSTRTHIARIDGNNINWRTYNFDVGLGHQTIRWIYTRGSTAGNSSNSATVWIDNVVGLNGPSQPSIGGFINGDATPQSGVIHGYLNAKGAWAIHGYMSGAPLYSVIHGYVNAIVTESGVIHGYLNSSFSESIHGYMFGRGTEMESSIHGYVGPGTGVFDTGTAIHGFMVGEGEANRIHGYLLGDIREPSQIHGYMFGEEFANKIHGYLNADGGASGIIYGFLPASISFSSIHGYIGNNALAISGGGTVAGGPGGAGSTSGVEPTNWIHGYLKGEEGGQKIHGYLEGPPGSFGSIYGYMPVGGDSTIHGFVEGNLQSTSQIHGYLDAVGFQSGVIHGYMYGVAGISGSQIHGYLTGALTPSGIIYGFLIGIPSGVTSQSTCYTHGMGLAPYSATSGIPVTFFNYP